MKSHTNRSKWTTALAIACVASLASGLTPTLRANDATTDTKLKQLEDENAALRQRLAELTGTSSNATTPAAASSGTASSTAPAAAAPSGSVQTSNGAPTVHQEGDVAVLSPFEVNTSKDYGYLKTNAVTASRINMPIQEIPMYLQVLSSDFVHDTNMQSLTDILRYTAGASGDNSFVSARPSNSATPQGSFTMRGFTVNTLLRDGIFDYSDFNLDNIDRIEIVQGPAAVFFGAGYPGGVINIVTKQPEFHQVPTTLQYTYGQDKENKVILDTNQQFGDKAAMRIVMGWENAGGQRQFEYNKTFDVAPSVTLDPLSNGKLKITVGEQYLKSRYLANNGGWIYPAGWFAAYQNPSAALIAAGGTGSAAGEQARIFNSAGNWGADNRVVIGDPVHAIYTTVSGNGYETGLNGQTQTLKNFDFHSRGAFTQNEDNIGTVKLEMDPVSWLNIRYVYTKTNSLFDDMEGNVVPNADGQTFNTVSGISAAGYHNYINNHQVDFVIKTPISKWGIDNKVLGGFVYQKMLQQYNTPYPVLNYATTPGATNPVANPGNAYVPTYMQNTTSVPVNQVLYNRAGQILQVNQVYSMWDPAVNQAPDINVLYPQYNTTQDGYATQDNDRYLNDQLSLLDGRLNFMGGYRQEIHRDAGQDLTANFPYFSPGPYAWAQQNQQPSGVYNYSPSYQETNFDRLVGSSWMGGVSFNLTKAVTLYATTSKTFKLNTGNAGGVNQIDLPNVIQAALTHGGGSFQYHNSTITSIDQGIAAVNSEGALTQLKNEVGYNYEFGVKTSLWDDKLVGTFSIFRGTRNNQKLDDTQAQSNASEPFNYSTTMFDSTSPYYNTRNFRWRTVGVQNLIYGGEMQAIVTPIRNFQSVINFSYLPTARTVTDPRYNQAYAAASVVNAAFYKLYYGSRIENVPEYTFNTWNKYTFDTGFLKNFSVAVGTRYVSKRVYSRSIDWNPMDGGWQMPSFVVFDGGLGYNWELMGYRINSQLNAQNLANKTYYEGGVIPSQGFAWQFTNGITF